MAVWAFNFVFKSAVMAEQKGLLKNKTFTVHNAASLSQKLLEQLSRI